MWGKATQIRCLWEYKLVQPLWKTEWRYLNIQKIDLPYDPSTPLLGISPYEMKSAYARVICTLKLLHFN